MKRASTRRLLRGARSTARAAVLLMAVTGAPVAALLVHHSDQADRWLRIKAPGFAHLVDTLPAVYPPQLMPATVIALGLLALTLAALRISRGSPADPPALGAADADLPCLPVDQLVAPGSRRAWWVTVALLGGAWLSLLVLFVDIRVRTPESAPVVVVWLGLLAIALLAAAAVDARYRPPPWSTALGGRSLALLAMLVLVLTAWQARDLDSWRYSCIGDEWGVYARAATYVQEGALVPEHYFGPVSSGVYGVHAPFLSASQALVMAVAGTSNFGWRLSGVLALTLGVIPFVLFAGRLLGRAGLALALVVLCSSPLLFADAHSGYGWGQMRLWTLAAMATLAWALARCSLRGAVALGILCAACSLINGLAVFVAPLAVAVYAVALWRRANDAAPPGEGALTPSRAWAGMLVGACSLVYLTAARLPGWLASHPGSMVDGLRHTLWKTSLGPLVAYYLGADFFIPPIQHVSGPAEFLHTVSMMTVRAVLAPLTFRGTTHYVVGPVVDPVAGGLVMVGMVVTLLTAAGRRRSLLLWLFFVPAVILAGTLSPYYEYGDLRVTRLHYLVPFWAMFAGFGYEAIDGVLRPRLSPALRRVVLGLLLAAVASWGLWRIEVFIPAHEEPNAQVAAMRVLQESEPGTTVLACLDGWHPLGFVAKTYPSRSHLELVPEESFGEMLAHGPSGREALLFRLDVPDPEERALAASFLERYSAELRCTVLPGLDKPRILRCEHPPDRAASRVWRDGAASARTWLPDRSLPQ